MRELIVDFFLFHVGMKDKINTYTVFLIEPVTMSARAYEGKLKPQTGH